MCVTLEVLHVPDCPSLLPMLQRLRVVTDLPVTTREITTDGDAAAAGMNGPPTLLMDGVDPFAEPGQAPSSALLGRVGVGTLAGAAGAGPDGEHGLEFAEYGIEGQAGARAFGSKRNWVQNAWATVVRVTWRYQPW